MKDTKPLGNDIQMSTQHENRFTSAVRPGKAQEDK